MSNGQSSDFNSLREKIAEAVEKGDRMRESVADEVAAQLEDSGLDADGCRSLIRSVIEGAEEGFNRGKEDRKGGHFKEVIDGLADGFSRSAEAARLTMEEARENGRRFAGQDLRRAADNLRAASELFVETIGSSLRDLKGQAGEQTSELERHARNIWEGVRASLRDAADGLKRETLATGREALHAGTEAATQAAGVFFVELGNRLKKLSRRDPGRPS